MSQSLGGFPRCSNWRPVTTAVREDKSFGLRLSLLQLCYVLGKNSAYQPEELAAPKGVENPPFT
ncbi:MAG: hypothetical protein N2235_10165 [Fischerella sp.]|nr:hypothetical protein [Fischerella sp.]